MGNQFYKTVALVPLRGGSKSIPLKNIKDIAGKPLCAWVLEAASHAKNIDKVFVSTDSEAIRTVVDSLNLNIEIIQRPAAYSTDEASTESVMLHFMSEVNFEKVVTIQATSPLLKSTQL
jgi:N-acylneuraminate cytidylyltransferase